MRHTKRLEWFIRIHLLQRFVFYNSFFTHHLLHEIYKVEDGKPCLNKKVMIFFYFNLTKEIFSFVFDCKNFDF